MCRPAKMKTRNQRETCTSTKRATAGLLLSFLALSGRGSAGQAPAVEPWIPSPAPEQDGLHDFTLRHIFHRGTYQDPDLHKRLDIRPESTLLFAADDEWPVPVEGYPHLSARSKQIHIQRLVDRQPSSIEKYLWEARLTGQPVELDVSAWTLDEVQSPNVTDRETVINLATIASNAYVPIVGEGDWQDVSQGYNHSQGFGWEGDGLRGHIFADQRNETVIVSLKGTSPAVFDGDGTTTSDKLNDNLFFSCCCAQGGQYFWRQVCDCYSSTYTCNQTCVVKALRKENRYYRAAIDLYTNITELYPQSNIWLVGHSLGGAVSSLLGLTFGIPTVTFEAPGEDLAADRLGLPIPPSSDKRRARRTNTGVYHFGHTADPIFMGTCNGATATCTLGGYAMESQCHTGFQCVYDTVSDYGWRVGIGNHKIHVVIDDVIKAYSEVPECIPDHECVDCFNWNYFESNGSDTTTTSTSTTTSSTRTRTSTCETPGWWGCLDESSTTTQTSSTPVITTTYTTTTCATAGWFGCKEQVNITITTTTAPPTVSAPLTTSSTPTTSTTSRSTSTSCRNPGWFGCRDQAQPSSTPSPTKATPTANPHVCQTPGLFFGCRDRSSAGATTASVPITSAPSLSATATSVPPEHGRKCEHRAFFGLICLDGTDDVSGSTASSDGEEYDIEL